MFDELADKLSKQF